MVIEIYLFRFIVYCIIAFMLGYIAMYITLTRGDHGKGFNFFHTFKALHLPDLLELIWKPIVKVVHILTGIELEVFSTKK